MNIYFKEERLFLSGIGETIVRLVSYAAYIFLTSVCVLLFFSDVESLRWFSLLLGIFLFDRLLHARKGEKTVSEIGEKKDQNVALVCTTSTQRVLGYGFRRSIMTNEDPYCVMLLELVKRRDIQKVLARLDIRYTEFAEKISQYLTSTTKRGKEEFYTIVSSIAIEAYNNARVVHEKYIEPRNIFAAIISSEYPPIQKTLDLFNILPGDVAEAIIFGRYTRFLSGIKTLPSFLGGLVYESRIIRKRVMNRAWTSRPTPFLDQYGSDLTERVRSEKIGFLIGHSKEYEEILRVISRPGKPNALLVGDPGSGKSTIVAHLAFQMVKDNVPKVLFDKRLISLNISKLVSGATQEQMTDRMQRIVQDILNAGNIVLFIPNIHDLFRTTNTQAINVMDLLLPIIESQNIPVIGDTYPKEFKSYIAPRTDFLDQFDVVQINEISEEEAMRFLVYRSIFLEHDFKVFITFKAIRKSVELAHRYFRNKLLPGSASDLLKEAIVQAERLKEKILTQDFVIDVAEKQSKIPIQGASGLEAEQLLNLEETIHEKLVNQKTAVRDVAQALREYRSGLSRQGGPIATFLFVGPTGVGKTELAKILAKIQFGSKDSMQRFDMSEYQDKQSIFRLIGTPDGTKSGTLTDGVMQEPYSLVLLDEFEKAHPDVLNIFLQVFDDGRLSDSLGRTVSFENTIIIATSNAHSQFIKEEVEAGKTIEEVGEQLKKKLTDYFKPELINRFSDIVVFRNLSREEIEQITGLLVKEVSELLREVHGITLQVERGAIQKIAELGYSPVFGARPLRQVISEKIRGVLAEKILKKEIARGNTVSLDYKETNFVFQVTE